MAYNFGAVGGVTDWSSPASRMRSNLARRWPGTGGTVGVTADANANPGQTALADNPGSNTLPGGSGINPAFLRRYTNPGEPMPPPAPDFSQRFADPNNYGGGYGRQRPTTSFEGNTAGGGLGQSYPIEGYQGGGIQTDTFANAHGGRAPTADDWYNAHDDLARFHPPTPPQSQAAGTTANDVADAATAVAGAAFSGNPLAAGMAGGAGDDALLPHLFRGGSVGGNVKAVVGDDPNNPWAEPEVVTSKSPIHVTNHADALAQYGPGLNEPGAPPHFFEGGTAGYDTVGFVPDDPQHPDQPFTSDLPYDAAQYSDWRKTQLVPKDAPTFSGPDGADGDWGLADQKAVDHAADLWASAQPAPGETGRYASKDEVPADGDEDVDTDRPTQQDADARALAFSDAAQPSPWDEADRQSAADMDGKANDDAANAFLAGDVPEPSPASKASAFSPSPAAVSGPVHSWQNNRFAQAVANAKAITDFYAANPAAVQQRGAEAQQDQLASDGITALNSPTGPVRIMSNRYGRAIYAAGGLPPGTPHYVGDEKGAVNTQALDDGNNPLTPYTHDPLAGTDWGTRSGIAPKPVTDDELDAALSGASQNALGSFPEADADEGKTPVNQQMVDWFGEHPIPQFADPTLGKDPVEDANWRTAFGLPGGAEGDAARSQAWYGSTTPMTAADRRFMRTPEAARMRMEQNFGLQKMSHESDIWSRREANQSAVAAQRDDAHMDRQALMDANHQQREHDFLAAKYGQQAKGSGMPVPFEHAWSDGTVTTGFAKPDGTVEIVPRGKPDPETKIHNVPMPSSSDPTKTINVPHIIKYDPQGNPYFDKVPVGLPTPPKPVPVPMKTDPIDSYLGASDKVNDYAAAQKQKVTDDNAKWTAAKQTLISKMTPEQIINPADDNPSFHSNGGVSPTGGLTYNGVFKSAGIDNPNAIAFTDSNGHQYSHMDVLDALRTDPGYRTLRNKLTGVVPGVALASGNKARAVP